MRTGTDDIRPSAHNKRLRSYEIGLYFSFAIFDQHRNDLCKIVPKLVKILALAMCTRKTSVPRQKFVCSNT